MTEWTIGTLKEYIESRLDAMEEAVGKAETAVDQRLAGLNELRGAMNDQQANFASKVQVDANFASLTDRLAAMTKRLDGIDTALSTYGGKAAGVSTAWGVLIQVIAALATVGAVFVAIGRKQ